MTQSLILRTRQGDDQRIAAGAEVLRRFLGDYGPATLRELANWSSWPQRAMHTIIDRLCAEGTVVMCHLENSPQTHFVRRTDVAEIEHNQPVEYSLVFLAYYDLIVRAQQTELRQRYGYGCSIPAFWHYLLIDEIWLGALHIHYKKNMLWIRGLRLEEVVLASPALLHEVLEAIRRDLTHNLNAVCIDNVNSMPSYSSYNREILSTHEYRAQDGSCVLDLTTG